MRLPFSILRSPGSKRFFLPYAERFLRNQRMATIVEPFAGSAIIGLTLLNRGYGQRLVLAEKDPALRHFYEVARNEANFAQRVSDQIVRLRAVPAAHRRAFALESARRTRTSDPALSVLLRTWAEFNSILNDEIGVSCGQPGDDWQIPELGVSLKFLYEARDKIQLLADGFDALRRTHTPDTYAFVDPTYTFTPESPGHKLYRYVLSEAEHKELINLLATWSGPWQLTSEFCPEMVSFLETVNFDPPVEKRAVPMHNASGQAKMELVVQRYSRDGGNLKKVS